MKPNPHFKVFRILVIFAVLTLRAALASSQTNINGVINTYHRVIEVIPAKACVRLNTVAGLARLQKVLLIQMKGASVITTNNSSFGDTTSLNNAGNYELAIICSIHGDSVFMFHNFLNSYTVADKVQLVKFAEYFSANVVDTVRASAWNNASGTGGVIALSVSQDLILNAPICADGSGFKGGAYIFSDGACTNFFPEALYYYDGALNSGHQSGAYKGESVYDFPASQSGGRGAPANGGGGGNNHNNGGGGGANLSAGGIGGGNSSSGGCTTELHALAGKPLKSWNGKKIFFGGGGGAGHADGTTIPIGGGDGGGIVFIHANTIIGNGYKISANGTAGGAAISDGASGGGAAGTIMMDVASYSGAITVQAKGGDGGNEDDAGTSKRCYGAGGGGSGGAIYFTGLIPAVTLSVAGGTAGLEYGGDPLCNAAVPATTGSAGLTIASYTLRQSTDSASYCLSISPLPVILQSFKALASQTNIVLKWQISNSELVKEFFIEKWLDDNWSPINKIPANDLNSAYGCVDAQPLAAINLYRLKIVEKDNSFFYSPVQQVIMNARNEQFIVYPNPATRQIMILGQLKAYSEVKLFQLTGQLVWKKTQPDPTSRMVIDLPGLMPGIYLLKLNEEIKKLVIR